MFNLIYLYVEVRFSLVHLLLSFSLFLFFLVCLLVLFLFFFPSCFTLSLLFCFLFFSSSFLLPKQMRKKNHQHLLNLHEIHGDEIFTLHMNGHFSSLGFFSRIFSPFFREGSFLKIGEGGGGEGGQEDRGIKMGSSILDISISHRCPLSESGAFRSSLSFV